MKQSLDSRFIKWLWNYDLNEDTFKILDLDGFIVAGKIPIEDLAVSIVLSHNLILDKKLPIL